MSILDTKYFSFLHSSKINKTISSLGFLFALHPSKNLYATSISFEKDRKLVER